MREPGLKEAEKYENARQRKKRWYQVVTCLAAVVVFCTTYALILPAITLSRDNPKLGADHLTAPCGESLTLDVTAKPEDEAGTIFYLLAHQENAGIVLEFDEENVAVVPDRNGSQIQLHREPQEDGTVGYWFVLPGTARETVLTLDCGNGVGKWGKAESGQQDLPAANLPEEELSLQTPAPAGEEPSVQTRPEPDGEQTQPEPEGQATAETAAALEPVEAVVQPEPLTEPADGDNNEAQEAVQPEEQTGEAGQDLTAEPERAAPQWEQQPGDPQADGTVTFLAGSGATLEAARQAATENTENALSLSWSAKVGQSRVDEVIALIDALPTLKEVEDTLTALDEAGDEEGYNAYYMTVYHQVMEAWLLYEDIGEELQQQVTNRDKLLAFEWMYAVRTLEYTNQITIQQVNCFGSASEGTDKVLLIYNSNNSEQSASQIVTNIYHFPDATSITVKNESGTLTVTEVDVASGSDKQKKQIPPQGFMIVIPTGGSIAAEVGESVTCSFDYTLTQFNSAGLGTVTFGSAAQEGGKPDKDNTRKLQTVPGADTRDIIEVNLYDYGNNINEKYDSNKSYPGFQQDKGSTDVGTVFSKWASFNFGNNITSDLAAGQADVTVAEGTGINATTNGANSPISGAMSPKLGTDGYPALSDGKSLHYLFSNNRYATKKNTENINGLFQYHEDTGAYTFNSRENHAQFDPNTNTFTLYNQLITSNFMMYPFGNFLPFNDIVHQCAQVSTIDKAYLTQIAGSAQKKSTDNSDAYNTLSTQLTKFIGLMDNAHPSGWAATDCMNEYFKAAAIPSKDNPKKFSDEEVQNLYSIDYDEPTDFYFGMEMKMNFMQPKDGLTGKDGQQPMVFYFTGDDDVWVYVDGVLFLDLSGIHRHVGGEIDFQKGEVRYYSLDVSTGDVGTTPYKTVKFSDLVGSTGLNAKGTFPDYSTHSFNFYYMERGSGSGVCRMNFNFPLLRKNSISVTKELSVDEPDKLPLLGNPDFKFQILKAQSNKPFVGPGVSYDILDTAGNKLGTGTTGDDGVFTLKANQTAVFSEIDENAGRYFVRELLDPDAFKQYGTIQVDGSDVTKNNENVTVGSDTFTGVDSPVKDMSSGSTSFHFNNQVTFNKLGSLSIEKTLTEYSPTRSASQFTFEVTLDGQPLPVGTTYTVGTESCTVTEEGKITLPAGKTAVISGILAGSTFTVKETEASSQGYVVTYTLDGVEQTGSDGVTGIIKTNTQTHISVNNAEQGTEVAIPVQKTLNAPDGNAHTYTIQLEQVTSETDLTPATPGFRQELPLTITTQPVTGQFTIGYAKNSLGTLPQTFYYKITEKTDGITDTLFDTAVYVVEVTVTNSDGTLTATITKVTKKDDKSGSREVNGDENTPQVSFTNQIIRYELPQTGGSGTIPLRVGGLLLTFGSAALLIHRYRKRRKGEKSSSS